jgi:hypothetical protein
VVFVLGKRSDKNGFSHPLYCTTFPITFGVYALVTVVLSRVRQHDNSIRSARRTMFLD